MSLFVDTSTWSLALRRDTEADARSVVRLREALQAREPLFTTGLILQELLQGFDGPKAREAIRERFVALPLIVPDRDDHVDASEIRNTCRRMNDALAKGPWLMGEQFTLADAIVAPLIDRMADLGFSDLWENDFSRVTDWYERIQQRPSFQATFYPGTRMSEFLPLTPAIKEG